MKILSIVGRILQFARVLYLITVLIQPFISGFKYGEFHLFLF